MTAVDVAVHSRTSTTTNRKYVVTPPDFHLIRYYNDYFRIPLPWKVFQFELFPTKMGDQPFLERVYAMKYYEPGTNQLLVSYIPLPNMYTSRPCTGSDLYCSVDENYKSELAIISDFWHERFSRDGWLARVPAWRWLTHRSGHKVTNRRGILSYWETLSLEEVLKEMPLPTYQILT